MSGDILASIAEHADMARYVEKGRAFLEGNDPHAISTPEQRAAVQKTSAQVFQQPRRVVTVHSRYGQPPGELAYIETQHWTPAQAQIAAQWLANEQAKDWWRAQGAAQREAS